MPITVADFPALTRDLQDIFNEVASQKVAENKGFSIFDVKETDRREYTHLILHGMSGIKKVVPGEDLPKISGREGDQITYVQSYYGGAVDITKEMRKFELHGQMNSLVKSLAEDAFDKIDQSFADNVLGGFDGNYLDPYGEIIAGLGPDGKVLFTDAHTTPVSGATYSNLCVDDNGNDHPPLSRGAIVATRVAARGHRDPNNILRPINLDVLLVSPALEDTANRIVLSQYLPGSGNNDINPLYNKVKVVVWDRLALNSAGVDTSNYWFMYDSQNVGESLKSLFAERPSLDAPEEVYINKNWEYTLDYFYTIGRGHAPYIWGSKGTYVGGQ